MTAEERQHFPQGIPIFAGLDDSALLGVAEVVQETVADAGSVIVSEGDPGNRMFITDFAGSVYSANLDGSNERNFLFAQGNLTGIAYVEI